MKESLGVACKMEKGPRIRKIPEGDSLERLVCPECDYIVYQNPLIVVGSVVTWQGQYMLCKRNIEPGFGLWTIPAGYMELNESSVQGAKREAMEEAEAEIITDNLLAIYNIPRISQVQLLYRAELKNGRFAPGPESQEVALFDWEAIPWETIAFPTVEWALKAHRSVIGQSAFSPFTNPI